ncbi:MAG TPA: hypothetical protein VNI77_02795 [Nitrososphaera sp.]|nr:hypothetical protein [Nitrososphaera sp.]
MIIKVLPKERMRAIANVWRRDGDREILASLSYKSPLYQKTGS